MKTALILIFSIILVIGAYGFYSQDINNNPYIGVAVLGLFLVWMPLFIVHRYKNKNTKDYMITDATLKKIKDEADTFLD